MDSGDGNMLNCAKNGNTDDEKDAFGKNTGYVDNSITARMPVFKCSTHYNMNHPRRGLAIIFNHENFTVSDLRPRAGTQTDCQCFSERLQNLGFDVEVYNDLSYKDLNRVIEQASARDHTENDCLLICVMSHGDTGILYAKDTPYKPETLWLPFTADKCPTLAGKPKLFFIQACQGSNLDKGITLSRTETDGQPHSYRIPTYADFLIAYSTVPDDPDEGLTHSPTEIEEGFFSWRNTTRGSWFIQALCEELKLNQYRMDLLTLLVFVSQRVALDYESNVPDTLHMHRQKQIPCVTTMLTRLVQFSPK